MVRESNERLTHKISYLLSQLLEPRKPIIAQKVNKNFLKKRNRIGLSNQIYKVHKKMHITRSIAATPGEQSPKISIKYFKKEALEISYTRYYEIKKSDSFSYFPHLYSKWIRNCIIIY